MSLVEIEEAAAKLPPADLARLLEDLRDLEIARTALAEIEAGKDQPVSWEHLKTELDALHG